MQVYNDLTSDKHLYCNTQKVAVERQRHLASIINITNIPKLHTNLTTWQKNNVHWNYL